MIIIIIALLNASIFSIDGIGEDKSVFRSIFSNVGRLASIEFTLQPEFNLLHENGNYRNIFWTNPFGFSLTIPVAKGFIFSAGNCERFSQAFDVYSEQEDLQMHLIGRGGINEIYANLNNNFGICQIALRGSYLFGNPWEIWDYSIGDYVQTDTFFYRYRGKIFSGGIKLYFVSLIYEGFGTLNMERSASDTTISLPKKLSVGINPDMFGGRINVLFERSFWQKNNDENYISPNRFKIGFTKNRYGISYSYNPWYLNDVTEHGLGFSLMTPIKNIGTVTLNLSCSLRSKGSLKEFKIIPELKFTLKEIFALRRY